MTRQELLKIKREKLLRQLGKTEQGKALVANRSKTEQGQDAYLDAVKQVNWLLGSLGAHFDDLNGKSNERLAGISQTFADEVTKIEKVLKAIAGTGETGAMLVELKDTKAVLKELAARKQPTPVVNVAAPVVHVKAPEATIIDKTETKIIAETKYQEQTVTALTGLHETLQKVAKAANEIGMTRIKSSMKDPVFVQLVDKKGRTVMDFSDMMQTSSGSSSSNTQYNEGDVDTTVTGTAIMWEDANDTMRAVSAAKPLPVDLAAPTAVSSFRQLVTTAGTRVQLPTFACKSVTITALSTNTGLIYIGSVAVTSANGHALAAGAGVSLDLSNVNVLYIDSSLNSQGVTGLAIN